MRWNTRIAILAGLACVNAAVFYFRVFQPGPPHSAIIIDSAEPPTDPFELVVANQLRSTSETGPRFSEPSERIATPLAPRVKQQQEAKPTLPKKVPQITAPTKSVVITVPIAKPKPRVYTVKSGDSLWRIARDQLGDASRHLELAELNKATLGGNSDSLKLGQKIILPPK